ncbi:sphingomyelin phosphodiesterase [Cordyceps javanica]|uniref:Sphingomyelin phosphodiesterase n=1 Tax=Cordyceps javanica TaxID=43265 RepID=A0A545VTU1_9HYPO|nr:sphingomyelin phosphodiesterase [Cordyceps javanica]TQW05141.1 sphingomyelin phosphodiesterase [Cordyceps javanica]
MHAANLLQLLAAAAPVATAIQDSSQPLASRAELRALERSIHQRETVQNVWDAINGAASCGGCQSILAMLKGVSAFGEEPFIKIAQAICKVGKVQDPDVCDGVISRQGHAVARVISELSLYGRTSKLFCSAVLGLCDMPDPMPMKLKFPKKKKETRRPPPSGKKPLKVVHISDLHIDYAYLPGSNTQCSKPICCSPYGPEDDPGVTKNPAGPFGDHKCDSPVDLEDSMYKAIREFVPDAAFAIFTGDIVDHKIWNNSALINEHDIRNSMTLMDRHFNTVYSTVGNHEMYPVNLITSTKHDKVPKHSSRHLYRQLVYWWLKWTGKESEKDILAGGAYATQYPNETDSKLRVISVNTNLYYRQNFEAYHEKMEEDPNDQFKWLVEKLDEAEKAGERAYIIGHMPMGDMDALHDPSDTFDRIVKRYDDTIAAMFFGHTHVDHFQLHYADYASRDAAGALAVSYIAPSLTPTSGMPSFRVYDVDPDTFSVLDVVQYAADMDDPAYQTTGPVWTKYYSARETYGALPGVDAGDVGAELTPAFWHNVTAAFERDEAAFAAFVARKSRGWNPQPCTGECRTNELCAVRGGRARDNCYKPKPGLNLSKRSLVGNNAHDDCGGDSAAALVLGQLTTNKEALEKLKEAFDEVGQSIGAKSFDLEKGWLVE